MIRSTGLFLAIVSAFMLAASLVFLCVALVYAGKALHTSIPIFLVLSFEIVFFLLLGKVGYDMIRTLNPTTIANFSFIVAVLGVRLLYNWIKPLGITLGSYLPLAAAEHSPARSEFARIGPELFPQLLAFLIFLLLYCLLKAWIARHLGFPKAA